MSYIYSIPEIPDGGERKRERDREREKNFV